MKQQIEYLIFFVVVVGMGACTKKESVVTPTDSKAAVETTTEKGTIVKIEIETNQGTIVAELDGEKAPITVKNFVTYANAGFYDGTIFHRVIDGFMIQGGGFASGMKEKDTQAPIVNEGKNGLKNEAYTLAMARTQDPNSATAQFFINLKDNAFLDATSGNAGYAVFGKVIEGKEIVDKIGKTKTHTVGYFDDVPKDDVIMTRVRVK